MTDTHKDSAERRLVTRRRFLGMSAATVAAGLLSACSTAAPSPTAAPAKPAAPAAPAVPAAPAAPAKVVTWRFGINTAATSTQAIAANKFSEELGKLSGGQFKVEVYPAMQLGDMRSMIEATQTGTQTLAMATPAWMSSFSNKWDVLSIPFLVKGEAKLWAACEGEFGAKLSAEIEKVGIKVVGWWAVGTRQLANNTRPINTPDDMKGLKLRVQPSPVWVDSFKALGANPVAMDFGEVYSALQAKTIDGYDNIYTDIFQLKFYEVVKYLSITNHALEPFGIYMNKKIYDGLTADQQKMIAGAMKVATDYQRKEQGGQSADSLAKLRGLMAVNDVSEANLQLFKDRLAPAYAGFEQKLGKEWLAEAQKALG